MVTYGKSGVSYEKYCIGRTTVQAASPSRGAVGVSVCCFDEFECAEGFSAVILSVRCSEENSSTRKKNEGKNYPTRNKNNFLQNIILFLFFIF